jgi:hypothetical protein
MNVGLRLASDSYRVVFITGKAEEAVYGRRTDLGLAPQSSF